MKKGIKLCSLFLGATLLAACGGSDSDENTTNVTIAQVTPANGSTGVLVISDIEITFDSAATQSDLNAMNIKLSRANTETPYVDGLHLNVPFNATLATDGMSAILDPSIPLLNGQKYQLTIGTQNYEFETVFNKRKRVIAHDFYDSNEVIRYTEFSGDAFHTNYVEYNSEGTDSQWFTADDQVDFRVEEETNSNNQIVTRSTFDAMNNLVSYKVFEYAANGKLERESNFDAQFSEGNDGILGTNDDIPAYFYLFTYSASENQVLGFDSVGADGTPFTSDDNQTSLRRVIINSDNTIAHIYSFSADGSDNVWGTDDDTISRGEQFAYNNDGNLLYIIEANENGDDNTLFTSDDNILDISFWDYTGLQRTSGGLITGAGSDATWMTNDDDVISTKEYAYNQHGQRTLYRHIYFGDDGELGTSDDRILEFVTEFDSNGFATVEYFRLINYFDPSYGFPAEILYETTEFDTTY